MELTPVIENFLNQSKQHSNVVSVSVEDASQVHMSQVGRLNLIVFHFVITVDSKNTPVDFVVPIENVNENSYERFSSALDDLLTCDCEVPEISTHSELKLDIQQAAMNNRGILTYYIRPPDGWRQLIYSQYANKINITDPIFLNLIEKLKSIDHVLEVNAEELLDNSILSDEEKQVTHVFFRCKQNIPGSEETRYVHFIMAEPNCCIEQDHELAISQLTTLVNAL